MKTLQEIRTSKGITKTAICKHLGISKPTYNTYEAEPESMRVETARKLAKFLGVDLEDIFFLSNSK